MPGGYLAQPLIFLVQVLFGLYALVVILRLLLQLVRADFHNPLSQFIVRATRPLLNPLRRITPGFGGFDLASLLLAWFVVAVEQLAILAILGKGLQPLAAILGAIPELLTLIINVFVFSILILVVISWINPGSYNPAISILRSLTDPLLTPVRRRMPDIGGLDLSPLVVMIGLIVLQMLLVPPVKDLVGRLA